MISGACTQVLSTTGDLQKQSWKPHLGLLGKPLNLPVAAPGTVEVKFSWLRFSFWNNLCGKPLERLLGNTVSRFYGPRYLQEQRRGKDDLARGLSEDTNNIPLANGGVTLKGVPEMGSDWPMNLVRLSLGGIDAGRQGPADSVEVAECCGRA